MLYDTYDLSGAVAEPGHYAFLADPDDTSTAVTTYEELRDGTATALLIHTHDAHGIPRAELYDAVEPGDLFEWKQADDCFVRYQVTAVKSDPTGTVPQKLLGVAWMTYAFTGCTGGDRDHGRCHPGLGRSARSGGGTSLTVPVVYGIYQLVPEDWTGATAARAVRYPPDDSSLTNPAVRTRDLAVARALPHWRDPVLPVGWTFMRATAGVEHLTYGYGAGYASPAGGEGLIIEGTYATHRGNPEEAAWRTGNGLGVYETRIIAGRPARVTYSPSGPNNSPSFPVTVWVYDAATESQYTLYGKTKSLRGANVDVVIAIAASLLEPPNTP